MKKPVVFTFQTEGRYNINYENNVPRRLFLPFKQKADTTLKQITTMQQQLFLPFKQKADTTEFRYFTSARLLFLPFKQKADTTKSAPLSCSSSCFYLSNRRQIQPNGFAGLPPKVVFTFQTEGRYNFNLNCLQASKVVFTFQTEGRYNHHHKSYLLACVVFTFQTEGRYNSFSNYVYL